MIQRDTHGGGPRPQPLLTTREAATFLSLSTRTLWSLTAPRGNLPVVRIPGCRRVLYDQSDLQVFINACKEIGGGK